jgi:NTP pyrophosphatase (non-canonical NTP hydrolase)
MNDIQAEIQAYLTARGWDKLSPADLAKSIMIEGAELLELFQWHNYTPAEIADNPELASKIKKELADVMIYCLELTIRLDIDPQQSIREKLEHNARKYPAEEMMMRKDKNTKESFYMQRKMEYRKEGK